MKKKSKSTLPKFFCENCNNEVKRNTRVCPHCGKFFASVKCPQCYYEGGPDEFTGGCPSCGYAIHNEKNSDKKKSKNKKSNTHYNYKSNKYDDPLPWWLYGLVMALLGAFIIFTVLMYR